MKGVFWAKLTDPRQLLDRVDPRFERIFADHVTLQPKVELTAAMQRLLGRKTRAHVRADAWNDHVQALEVVLEPEIAALCVNEHPHITVSSDGTPPKRANDMLAGEHDSRPCDFWVDLELQFKAFR